MNILEAFPRVCLMVVAACTIGIIVGYPAAHWIGGKMAAFLTFQPQERFAKAQPALGIPSAKAMGGDLQGAVDGYEELLTAHPHEREIHFRLLELSLGPMRSEEYGERVLQRGLASLPDKADRAALLTLAREIREGSYRPYHFLESDPAPARARNTVYDPDAPRLVKGKPDAGA